MTRKMRLEQIAAANKKIAITSNKPALTTETSKPKTFKPYTRNGITYYY